MAEYKELESPRLPATPTRLPLLERNVNINAARPPNFERPVLPHLDFEIARDLENEDVEDDSTSLSSYTPPSSSTTLRTPKRKLTKAESRAQKKEKKSVKSQNKALKSQCKVLAAVTHADVDNVAVILHGENHDMTFDGSAHPLATDKTIEDVISRNLNFVKNIQAHKQHLFKSVATGRKVNKERKRLKKRESRDEVADEVVELEEVVGTIMHKLGLSPAVISASLGNTSASHASSTARSQPTGAAVSRKRASLSLSSPSCFSQGRGGPGASRASIAVAVKLRHAIKVDLEKHENEVHMRYVRAGGFWRYVGKTVFERMTGIARELDVSTGEKWEKRWAREEKLAVEGDELAGPEDT